ncbi:chitobiosyldiphosphodolichol beta-mannosyltransferase [Plodia interpunctella]|uniref:chitobiosyldiphosphodolichol beta-mannosyltransferase n=1 Tax=Plodia interpunctella TaxID=58824 RepID=UPI002368BDAF|nr:chitobiosyldiphosphodolichol beta-mannosyltransferase [Plodia interpunctella]
MVPKHDYNIMEETKTVKVVVLGDIGRSPRMQYHALSLANNGFKVIIISYLETTPPREVIDHPRISVTKLNPIVFHKGPKLVQYVLKAIWQTISLFLTLFVSGRCDYLLCQNPPAIPTLPVCRWYCLITRTKFVIDWHNYAYSIMALALPPDHLLVKLSKFIERYFGQTSQYNLCVTYAMKANLLNNWEIQATVLYDRPPKLFHPITVDEKHKLFVKLSQHYPQFRSLGREHLNSGDGVIKTAVTEVGGGGAQLRPDRPGVLFSSTSWTPDEDFSVLMQALQVYETTYSLSETTETDKPKLPKLLCVITGKGPMKENYINQISKRNWKHVTVVTPWLEACDYPTMVASADLGVCLHTSSSGLDLPMKVVDMFGAGLPVCAYDFRCLDELVKNEKNGYIFKNSHELSEKLIEWFQDFPNNEVQNDKAAKMKSELKDFQKSRWEDNWNLIAKKIFES